MLEYGSSGTPNSLKGSRKSPRVTIPGLSDFHKYYYEQGLLGSTWKQTYWMGVRVLKCPLDLWVYQEILFETKPDIIIECGTFEGGSALYLASICDILNKGRILTIDIKTREDRPLHPRVEYFVGSSVDKNNPVLKCIRPSDSVMVILDSDHAKEHVLREMNIYGSIVTGGQYMVIEDGNLNELCPGTDPGPFQAIEEFLKYSKEFEVDRSREKFFLTFNPCGYLKKM